MNKITVVITGGTSGLGAITAKTLINTSGTRVILGNRNNQIKGAKHISLDLKSIDSVRSFTSEVIQKSGSDKINILICNAGMNFPNVDSRTKDGFETTFAVNHLAHYLLIRLLMPHMAKNAKIILTTSGTHDPAEKTVVAPPVHANIFWLAHPEKDKTLDEKMVVNAGRAYSSSKLCSILTTRYLNILTESQSGNWQGIAYDPGPTPGTGLMQNSNLIIKAAWQILTIPFLRKLLLPKSSSRKQAGKALADIALGKISLPEGKVYAALRKGKITFPNPSKLAQNDELMVGVWQDSAILLKI